MPVEGISHITLMVKNLDRTANLFCSVFGAEQIYSSSDKQFSLSKETFLIVGGIWFALMEGPPLSERSYNHIAFKIPVSEFEDYKCRLEAAGVEFRQDRPRIQGEGRSLYFYDFDNHLFELHTGIIGERLAAYDRK